MLVVMQHQATAAEVAQVVATVEKMGLAAHPMPGPTRTAIGITGNSSSVDPRSLEVLPGVRELIRVTRPYKLASREMHPEDTTVEVGAARIGSPSFTVIAGPCSVESESNLLQVAEYLMSRGVRLLRAGAFKPRTSPYSFQGMEHEGLEILRRTREKTGIGIVTEVMDTEQVDIVAETADMVQIGTRNMQNFSLLKKVAGCNRPVLLKRGMSATLDEWLMAAEYLLAGGNKNVVLCERGVRTFTDHTRNTLDLSVVPPVKENSHLPILIDPSHGTGRRNYVPAMARAGLAAGADGLMVEVHPDPSTAMSDGAQTLDFEEFDRLLESLQTLADPLQRSIG